MTLSPRRLRIGIRRVRRAGRSGVARALAAACRALPPLALLVLTAAPLAAQDAPARLGRPYVHVFLAYAVAVLLIGGWVVSIARRLARIERRLDRDAG